MRSVGPSSGNSRGKMLIENSADITYRYFRFDVLGALVGKVTAPRVIDVQSTRWHFGMLHYLPTETTTAALKDSRAPS
jgi:hypothetical protein